MNNKDKFVWEIQINENGDPIIIDETMSDDISEDILTGDNGIQFEPIEEKEI